MTHTVGELMSTDVVPARRDTAFKDMARLLEEHRISGVPVIDPDGKVLGVVSETDLIRHQAAGSADDRTHRPRMPALRRSARHAAAVAHATVAQDLMSTPAITVHPDQSAAEAARLMERHGVERLPVVDEEDRLIGIATRQDLLRVFLRTDYEIAQEIRDEVLSRTLGLPTGTVIVSVRDGMVTLEGRLERRSAIPRVIRSTWRVDGVVGVVNSLTFRIDDTQPQAKHPSRRIHHHWLPER